MITWAYVAEWLEVELSGRRGQTRPDGHTCLGWSFLVIQTFIPLLPILQSKQGDIMPVKFRKNCKICIAVADNKSLMNEIYNTRSYMPGGESVVHFAKRTGLHYKALINHIKNHQFIDDSDLTSRQLTRLHESKTRAMAESITSSMTARQLVLDHLYNQLALKVADGGIVIGKDISAKEAMQILLTSAKNTDDVNAKKGDQAIDVMKQLQGVRSGGDEEE